MAELLPLRRAMDLIKGRKAKREEPRDEEMFRFPALDEPWELSCGASEWQERTAGNRKTERPAVARGLGGSAVA
jgi:hypothetical protein